jgi:hypothetical protein
VGLDQVVRALEGYRAAHFGAFLAPAPLLLRFAREGKRFT